MIVLGPPTEGGRKTILAREEIKTGALDSHAKAQAQLDERSRLFEQASRGQIQIRLEAAGVDITGQVDLGSDARAAKATRGPAGKEFVKSLNATAAGLEALFRRLVKSGQSTGSEP